MSASVMTAVDCRYREVYVEAKGSRRAGPSGCSTHAAVYRDLHPGFREAGVPGTWLGRTTDRLAPIT